MDPFMPTAISRRAQSPACPRCGYDLAGTPARWQDSCDLDGTCPECGLAFRWGDVMDPARSVPLWFFENIHRPIVPTALRTVVRMLRPLTYWSRVRLSFPIQFRRLRLLVLVVFVVVHCILAAGSLLALGSSLAAVKRGIPGTTVPSPTAAYLKVLIWPYGSHRAEFSYPMRQPAGMQTINAFANSPAAAKADLLAALAVVGVMPVAYLLLAQTLRRTKVRRAHLFRIAAYSFSLLIPIAFFQMLSWPEWSNFNQSWNTGSGTIASFLGRIRNYIPGMVWFFFIELALIGLWWHAATVRYLRLPHTAGVVLSMLAIAGLTAFLLLTLTGGWRVFFPI
jgi:hypothetical protein